MGSTVPTCRTWCCRERSVRISAPASPSVVGGDGPDVAAPEGGEVEIEAAAACCVIISLAAAAAAAAAAVVAFVRTRFNGCDLTLLLNFPSCVCVYMVLCMSGVFALRH